MKKVSLLCFILFFYFINIKGQMQGSETTGQKTIYSGTFVVNGDKDTYYPVVFKYGNQNLINNIKIWRSYNEAGPTELSPTHKGSLLLEIDVNYGGWGGISYDWRIEDYRQRYHTTFADACHAMHNMGFIVWLRGGGFIYHYQSNKASNLQVCYSTSELIYNSSNDGYDVYAPAARTEPNTDNINEHLNVGNTENSQGNEIWHTVAPTGGDDAAVINQALNTYRHVSLLPGKTYKASSTITIQAHTSLNIPGGTTLEFDNLGDFSAVDLWYKSVLTGEGTIKMKRTSWDWSAQRVGVRINECNGKIDFNTIDGFEYGLILHSAAKEDGVGWNNVNIRHIKDCIIGIMLSKATDGWVNQNYIHINEIGSYRCNFKDNITTNDETLWTNHSVGIYMTMSGNTNTFSGAIEHYSTGMVLAGSFNRIEGLRFEECYPKITIYDKTASNNYLFGDYGGNGGYAHIYNYTGNKIYDILSVYGWADRTSVSELEAKNLHLHSDRRHKENIKDITGALNKILAIRGTEYNLKRGTNKKNEKVEKNLGFIAQELKEVLPTVVKKSALEDSYVVNYIGVIPVIVEAFKEQQEIIDKNDEQINKLQEEIHELKTLLKEAGIVSKNKNEDVSELAILYQNTPNPSNSETEIAYYVPANISLASIIITDMNGRLLKNIMLSELGENKIIIKEKEFEPGMYIYSLITDGKLVGTKRMVLTE